jgi:hypothetical protein
MILSLAAMPETGIAAEYVQLNSLTICANFCANGADQPEPGATPQEIHQSKRAALKARFKIAAQSIVSRAFGAVSLSVIYSWGFAPG